MEVKEFLLRVLVINRPIEDEEGDPVSVYDRFKDRFDIIIDPFQAERDGTEVVIINNEKASRWLKCFNIKPILDCFSHPFFHFYYPDREGRFLDKIKDAFKVETVALTTV